MSTANPENVLLTDRRGRSLRDLRISVTDRCNFRCTYCMPAEVYDRHYQHLPRQEILRFEEIVRLVRLFVQLGVKKIRLTGGEPLLRKNLDQLVAQLAEIDGVEDIALTTNGYLLAGQASRLKEAGLGRVTVSLDSLDEKLFREMAGRNVSVTKVLEGIEQAVRVGFSPIKINMVVIKGFNENEIAPMMEWAHERGFDLTLIEEMPLGDVTHNRSDTYLALKQVRDDLAKRFTLDKIDLQTGGPARYVRVKETGGRLGFITPMSHNFCESCNRVRLTCTGQLYMCLGQEGRVDLRSVLREHGAAGLGEALEKAMILKPKGHDFDPSRRQPAVARFMSTTGG